MTELASGSNDRELPVLSTSHVFRKKSGSHAPVGVSPAAPAELDSTIDAFGDRNGPNSKDKWPQET